METIELITKLQKIILNSPSKLNGFDWDQVYNCCIAELNLRKKIYSDEKNKQLVSHLRKLTSEAEQASRFGDFFKLQNTISCLYCIMISLPEADDISSLTQQALFDNAALNHYKKDTSVVIGDSHVNFFSGNESLSFLAIGNSINLCPQVNSLNLSVLHLGSCLAYTCLKPNSNVGFYNKIELLKDTFIKPGSKILLSLGEIDIRCHVFKQVNLQNQDFRIIIDKIIANYQAFISSLINSGFSVYCWGPIGTQKDSVPTSAEAPRYGCERERNTASFYFTDKLSNICRLEGAHCLSILEHLVDSNMDTKEIYLSPDRFHIGQKAMEFALPLLNANGLT